MFCGLLCWFWHELHRCVWDMCHSVADTKREKGGDGGENLGNWIVLDQRERDRERERERERENFVMHCKLMSFAIKWKQKQTNKQTNKQVIKCKTNKVIKCSHMCTTVYII